MAETVTYHLDSKMSEAEALKLHRSGSMDSAVLLNEFLSARVPSKTVHAICTALRGHLDGNLTDDALLTYLQNVDYRNSETGPEMRDGEFLLQPSDPTLYTNVVVPGGPRGDSGVDLRFPEDVTVPPMDDTGRATILDLGVRARCRDGSGYLAYWLTPRSSIAKTPIEISMEVMMSGDVTGTPLTLANVAGLIDKTYQGPLKVALRNRSTEPWKISKGDAYFQLVRRDLAPSRVTVVEPSHEAFAVATLRGAGGFGSTGAAGGTGAQAAPSETKQALGVADVVNAASNLSDVVKAAETVSNIKDVLANEESKAGAETTAIEADTAAEADAEVAAAEAEADTEVAEAETEADAEVAEAEAEADAEIAAAEAEADAEIAAAEDDAEVVEEEPTEEPVEEGEPAEEEPTEEQPEEEPTEEQPEEEPTEEQPVEEPTEEQPEEEPAEEQPEEEQPEEELTEGQPTEEPEGEPTEEQPVEEEPYGNDEPDEEA